MDPSRGVERRVRRVEMVMIGRMRRRGREDC